MSTLEEIQAAIEWLTELKAGSQGEIWYRSVRGVSAFGDEIGVTPVGLVDIGSGRRFMHTSQCLGVDADLIVTLHRTIDAQLAILLDAAARLRVEQNHAGIELHYRHALALARAINGTI